VKIQPKTRLTAAQLATACTPLTGLQIYEMVETRARIERGEAPPAAVRRRCMQDATVRDPKTGAWTWDQAVDSYDGTIPKWRRVPVEPQETNAQPKQEATK